MKEKFTDTRIRSLEVKPSEYSIADLDCPILRLRVSPTGVKTFSVQFKHNGKQIKQKIGKSGDISITRAREVAREIRAKVSSGEDIAIKGPEKGPSGITVEQLLNEFQHQHFESIKERTQKSYQIHLEWMISNFGDYEADQIDYDTAKSMAERYANGKKFAYNRFVSTIRCAWNIAIQNRRTEKNPFTLLKKYKETPRDEKADGDELGRIVESIMQETNPISKAYHLTILYTMCRRGEANKMRWKYLDGNIWTKPKEITKNGKEQRVFLIPEILEVLGEIKKPYPDELVFQNFQGWTRAWRRILTRAGLPYPGVRVHDLRRSVAVWLLTSEKANVQEISFLLGHSSVAITQRVYAAYLGDNRKATMAIGGLFKK